MFFRIKDYENTEAIINKEMIVAIEKIIEALMQKYNYEYVRTPIFESSSLFHRGVGETSDIVSKETY